MPSDNRLSPGAISLMQTTDFLGSVALFRGLGREVQPALFDRAQQAVGEAAGQRDRAGQGVTALFRGITRMLAAKTVRGPAHKAPVCRLDQTRRQVFHTREG